MRTAVRGLLQSAAKCNCCLEGCRAVADESIWSWRSGGAAFEIGEMGELMRRFINVGGRGTYVICAAETIG